MFKSAHIAVVAVAALGLSVVVGCTSSTNDTNVDVDDDLSWNGSCAALETNFGAGSCTDGVQTIGTVTTTPNNTMNVNLTLAAPPKYGDFSVTLSKVDSFRPTTTQEKLTSYTSPKLSRFQITAEIVKFSATKGIAVVQINAPLGIEVGAKGVVEVNVVVAGKSSTVSVPLVVVQPQTTVTNTSTCAPVTITQVHNATNLPGNTRLGQIVNGKVACIYHHDEAYPLGWCTFDTQTTTKAWVTTNTGNYAVANRFTKFDGTPNTTQNVGDEDWVIASGGTNGTVPCVPVGGADSAGTSTSTELGGSCALEVFNVATNALGFPMDNCATLDICQTAAATAASNAADLVSTTATGTTTTSSGTATCVSGEGASLNDATGRERACSDSYITGAAHYCHVVEQGGYQVFGAKRVATRNAPPPARTDATTSVWWRPISPLTIANNL